MAVKLWEASTNNAFSTTLNGSIGSADTTITLTTTTGLTAPGVLVIDRQDGSDNNTPTVREYISFTGVSGSDITGVTRELGGSSAQSHSSGALIEEVFSITHWNDLIDFLEVSHDSSGNIVTSTATAANVRVYDHLNASGASITGKFPIHPGWVVGGLVSLATTSVGKPLPSPQGGQIQFFSAVLNEPVASGQTLTLDINKNYTTIFTDQNTRLSIGALGTYASTASIAINSVAAGDIFTMDIDVGGGTARDLTVLGRIE